MSSHTHTTGTLYIVGTPIGNLSDMSSRVREVLQSVDLILSEDTRVTQKLLTHFNIATPVRRYNEHAPDKALASVIVRLMKGESIAFTTDAGMPGVSDPGARFVRTIRGEVPDVPIRVIPGPSAVVAALAVSGISAATFTFMGYPPAKRKRTAFFAHVASCPIRPVVLYESPHRLQKTLSELSEHMGSGTRIFVGRELTKLYEDHFWGSCAEAQDYFTGERARGEFVLVIE